MRTADRFGTTALLNNLEWIWIRWMKRQTVYLLIHRKATYVGGGIERVENRTYPNAGSRNFVISHSVRAGVGEIKRER